MADKNVRHDSYLHFGWLMRSVHAWSANLMILFGVLHLATVYLSKAYRRPRELTWVSGCLLFFVVLAVKSLAARSAPATESAR